MVAAPPGADRHAAAPLSPALRAEAEQQLRALIRDLARLTRT